MNKLIQTSRLNQILIVLLLLQIALAAFVFRPGAAASEASPLLPNFKASEVTALTITDNTGQSVSLAKEGEDWVLPEAGDYPANGSEITTLLQKIEAVQTNRLIAETQDSHSRLEVGEEGFNRRLDLTLADGTTHQFFVGSTGGVNATHVRVDDQPQVYLAGEISPWEIYAEANNWVNPVYFTISSDDVTALTLENSNGTFEFTREGETWTMAGLAEDETFSENNFSTLLSQSTSVQMTQPIGTEAQASFGLDDPSATVTLETADETYTLQIGAQDAEDSNSYYFKASNSPYYVKIAGFTGDTFTQKTQEDFLLPPSTPEADTVVPEAEGEESSETE